MWDEAIGGGGLGEAGFAAGADLDGGFGAGEKVGDLTTGAKPGKMFSDEMSMTKTAFANVLTNGGEGDNDGIFVDGESLI